MTKTIRKKAAQKTTPKIKPRKTVFGNSSVASDKSTANVNFLTYKGKAADKLFQLKPENIYAGLISPMSEKEF